MSEDPVVSHGRGGAGNIEPDDTPYSDGEIVREGPVGDQGDGAYSTGRGGAANIGSPGTKATKGEPHDADIIPETAMRDDAGENYHVGRGGIGNEHTEEKDKHTSGFEHDGLADKLKHKLFKGSK